MYNINIPANWCKRIAPNRIRYIFDKDNLKNNISLNYLNNSTLQNVSFNVYLSRLKAYRILYLYINILVVYYNDTNKKALTKKCISFENLNKYININLNNCINPLDLGNFKLIFIDIYTPNSLLYIVNQYQKKSSFINLQFTQYKNHCKYSSYSNNNYDLNNTSNLHSYITNNKYLIPPSITAKNNNNLNNSIHKMADKSKYTPAASANINDNNLDDIHITHKMVNNNKSYIVNNGTNINTLDDIIHTIDNNFRSNRNKIKHKPENLYSLLTKFVNKYIDIKVEFNGVKVLHGILNNVTNDTITLKDDDYSHIILIDSISIIHIPGKVNIPNISFTDKNSDISKTLKYLKDNNIKIDLNDDYMNISTVKIINYCDSFIQVEDTNSKKTYFFNSAHIKTIERIPQK